MLAEYFARILVRQLHENLLLFVMRFIRINLRIVIRS